MEIRSVTISIAETELRVVDTGSAAICSGHWSSKNAAGQAGECYAERKEVPHDDERLLV